MDSSDLKHLNPQLKTQVVRWPANIQLLKSEGPFRLLVVGPSGCGKSTFIVSFIKKTSWDLPKVVQRSVFQLSARDNQSAKFSGLKIKGIIPSTNPSRRPNNEWSVMQPFKANGPLRWPKQQVSYHRWFVVPNWTVWGLPIAHTDFVKKNRSFSCSFIAEFVWQGKA